MTNILDLDSLAPQPRVIKFGGKQITVNAPKTVNVLRIGHLGQKFEQAGDISEADLGKALDELTTEITKVIPELQGQTFNMAQLMGLMTLIKEMAMPADAKELEARKITTTSPKAQ